MSFFDQARPPKASLTEQNLPSQRGRIYLVTGGNAGVGYHLCNILYGKGAKVYMAARNESKANIAIEKIKEENKSATDGELCFLQLDLSDLNSVKEAAVNFRTKEQYLHVLWNNAGISVPPAGSESAQGVELQMAVNCLGPYLFSKLLLPQLRAAAADSNTAKNSVRTVWAASYLVDAQAPKNGISADMLASPPKNPQKNYAISKCGNWFLASEFNRREAPNGVISVAVNPGNLNTDIWTNAGRLIQFVVSPILHDPKYGAYSELWAGLSTDVPDKDGGCYVIPWGRWHPSPRKDLLIALKPEVDGGSGNAQQFWEWCDNKSSSFTVA